MSEWICGKVYCTCAGGIGACACAPAPEANDPARYAVSSCAACGHEVMHRRACGECERYPCTCPPTRRVGDALHRASLHARLALIGINYEPNRLTL